MNSHADEPSLARDVRPHAADHMSRASIVKARVRREVLARRAALTSDERQLASAAICRRTAELPEFARATTVMLFASFASEVETGPLIRWALAKGKTVCLPRVLGPHEMAAFRIADPLSDLRPGTWNIPEPCEGLPEIAPTTIDAVVVPGSVFDVDGRRYGYGGGFYDTFLPRTKPGTPRVALAFEVQVVENLVTEGHDLLVDVVVTESRTIRRAGAFLPSPTARRRV
jgi:5-formyltetrahydrofolate cyclo-ligase